VHAGLGVGALATGAGVGVDTGVGAGGGGGVSAAEGAAGSSVRLQAQPRTNQESVVMRRLGLRCMMIGVLERHGAGGGNEMRESCAGLWKVAPSRLS